MEESRHCLTVQWSSADCIERTMLKDVENCCLELLKQWLQGRVVGASLTWRTLLLATSQAGCTRVAQQVWRALAGDEGECMHNVRSPLSW